MRRAGLADVGSGGSRCYTWSVSGSPLTTDLIYEQRGTEPDERRGHWSSPVRDPHRQGEHSVEAQRHALEHRATGFGGGRGNLGDHAVVVVDAPGGVRRAIESNDEDEEHWSFRAVSATHHISALNRIRNATTAAGLTEGVSGRRLFLLRTAPWSPGTRTQEVIKVFGQASGKTLGFPRTTWSA